MVPPRPLDPLRSIKAKLGVLVVVTVAVSSFSSGTAWPTLDWPPRYTLPVAVLLALGVTQVLARGMTSPLRSMTAAARAMARGDYRRRVPDTSRDEVGELARAFNRMAADLETADRDRRELIANVSHELRTPISALHAILENLVDGVADPEPATLRAALAQTERLGRLVRELLDLARIDAGTEPLDRRRRRRWPRCSTRRWPRPGWNGRDVAVRGRRVAAGGRGRGLTAPGCTRCSRTCSTTPRGTARRGGTVQVTARSGPHGLHLEVADDGPGIAPADRDRVFERFYRGGRRPPVDGGTGLGLAIARWAVALHGGRIGLADETGSRFIVDLPGRPEEAA